MAEMTVGHYTINFSKDHIDMPVAVVAHPAQNDIWKVVAVLSIVFSAIGIGDLSVEVGVYTDPYQDFLLKVYAVVILATFALGMGLLLLPVVLRQVPASVATAKKLVRVVFALVYIASALNIILHVDFGGFK